MEIVVLLEVPGLEKIFMADWIVKGMFKPTMKPEHRQFWLLTEKDIAYNPKDGTE